MNIFSSCDQWTAIYVTICLMRRFFAKNAQNIIVNAKHPCTNEFHKRFFLIEEFWSSNVIMNHYSDNMLYRSSFCKIFWILVNHFVELLDWTELRSSTLHTKPMNNHIAITCQPYVMLICSLEQRNTNFKEDVWNDSLFGFKALP